MTTKPIHPCAEVFPKLGDADLQALAEDIKANGLQSPIVLWTDGSVLDGRNRIDALICNGADLADPSFYVTNRTADPAAFVIGANIRRRHLTKDQQAELIIKTIEAGHPQPVAEVTEVGLTEINIIPVSRRHVPTGKPHGPTPDPLLAVQVTEAAKHGISKATVMKARARLRGKKSKQPEKVPSAEGETTVRAKDFEKTRQILNERIAQIANQHLTKAEIGQRLNIPLETLEKNTYRKVDSFLIHAQLLPWVTLTRIDNKHLMITVDQSLKDFCDLHRNRPTLGRSLSEEFIRIRTEIIRRRKDNHDERVKRGWNPENVVKLFQGQLLDWVEDQLDVVAEHLSLPRNAKAATQRSA